MKRIPLLLAFLTGITACLSCDNSVLVKCDGGERIRLEAVSPEIVRVSEVPSGKIPSRESLAVLPLRGNKVRVNTEKTDSALVLSTGTLTVTVCKKDASITFSRPDGTILSGNGRASFKAAEIENKKAWSTSVSFYSPADEAFYGLGQHQSGELNHKGLNEELYQYNTKISVPFVLSTKGYGILFDAYSLSRWGNPEPYSQIGGIFRLYDKDGIEGALTGTYIPSEGSQLVRREDSLYFENERVIRNLPAIPLAGAKVVYEGFIEAREEGDYHFTQYYAGFQRTVIGDEEMMSKRWRPAWNPNSYKFIRHFAAGERVPITIEWEPDGDVSYFGLRTAPLRSDEEQSSLTFSSEFEPSLDYYFIAGDSADEIIKGYRLLTGKASVIPKWALGFWQSRERYRTQEELVGTLAEMRRRHIPVDNIVQDWQYWKDDQWGSHEFDPERYPDPEKMISDVHSLHGRFMISVWPKFYINTDNYKELKEAGYAYTHAEDSSLTDWLGHPESFYDAYAEGGRKMFWRQIDERIYSRFGQKVDAWWMDASEPNLRDCLPMEYHKWLTTPNALGSSTEYLNTYALVNAKAIYEGQRSVSPDKRVFLLTRSGFAGLQRYSTASWSGDIGTSWTDMRMQMAAGLGYSMSGLPFWGMDAGGFSVMGKFYDAVNIGEWRELQTRWHQFAAFVPIFRAHGQWPPRELWNIAPEDSPAYQSILWYMRLRYRLMPYIYSLAGAVHFDDYTMMRGLVMDFPDDSCVRDISDQWMFGPALMPCPVYEYGARSRDIYLPQGTVWYDFYTGEACSSGVHMTAEAPYERMPLFIRGGSIIPVGPEMEWCDEVPAEEILFLVYAGADAVFTLYEDDGETYGYENGEYCRIPVRWDDAAKTITIGEREGSWPGTVRKFRVLVTDPSRPHPFNPDAMEGESIDYKGNTITKQFNYE